MTQKKVTLKEGLGKGLRPVLLFCIGFLCLALVLALIWPQLVWQEYADKGLTGYMVLEYFGSILLGLVLLIGFVLAGNYIKWKQEVGNAA